MGEIELKRIPPQQHDYCADCGRGYHETPNPDCRCMAFRSRLVPRSAILSPTAQETER